MRPDPIDYNSPLGISKREWTRVLGANLAILVFVYATALVLTLTGNGAFLLNFRSDDLDRFEALLRSVGMYPVVQGLFATAEMTIVSCYVAKARPKWWHSLSFLATLIGINVLLTHTIGGFPGFVTNALMIAFWAFGVFALNGFKPKEK